ncbi:MAG: hypothetical protein JNL32_08430 [Candidatus Kapabacteria bacterium]|nr:hypothetical protein [Candidatus Kapabacteria bacterium]
MPATSLHLQAFSDEVTEAEAGDSDDEEPPPKKWTLSARSSIMSNQFRNGVQVSNNQPTLTGGLRVTHSAGAYGSITGTRRLGANGFYQQTNLLAGYTYSAADYCDLYADYTYFIYPNDDVNLFATATSLISAGASFYTPVMDIDVILDRYLGTDDASFVTLNFSRYIGIGEDEDLSVSPMFSVSVTRFEVTTARAKRLNLPAQQKWGLSSVSLDAAVNYALGKGFSASLDPMYLITFIGVNPAKASNRTSQFVITAGMRYAFKF